MTMNYWKIRKLERGVPALVRVVVTPCRRGLGKVHERWHGHSPTEAKSKAKAQVTLLLKKPRIKRRKVPFEIRQMRQQ